MYIHFLTMTNYMQNTRDFLNFWQRLKEEKFPVLESSVIFYVFERKFEN